MYGRLYLFPFGSSYRARLEAAVDWIAPRYPKFPGLRSVVFFMDEEQGVCGTFSQWDSQEAAEAATEILAGELTELVSEIASDAEVQHLPLTLPARLTFELYEPKRRPPD